jgi:hypothetical protein
VGRKIPGYRRAIGPECWVVTDADDGAWWLASDGQWHEGTPPAGWVQAGDRRWYPDDPPETARGYASKFESAGGRTAKVLALVGSADPPAVEDPEGDAAGGDGEGDDQAWSLDDPAKGEDDDFYDQRRRQPAWVLVTVLVGLLVAVVGVVGLMAGTDGGTDGEAGPTVDSAPPSTAAPRSTTTVTTPGTTVDAGPLSPSVTVAPPTSLPSTTVTRPVTTPSTTVPPDPGPAPPPTGPNPSGPPGQASIREGGRCFDVGETAVATNGTPVTCATTACDGDPYDDPRWRRTTC